ncbi:Glycoside hydrolase family 61 [Penicillium macrosclerotiorum]|uniref:Glycoside hydrolase family 61 n=1 Tax=Penicillium macrosclerotiorum TaxID=303699 RepID=UPI002547C331|nr:Glycoside hydrolase family 61 [Penicillium macrosclerotiorum]KAJ5675631.1 Glycoside hydrolase family 61 [Penicillium macrosclerotiorum]
MALSKIALLSTLLGAVSMVTGHGFVSSIVANGQNYTGYIVNSYPYMSDPPESVGWATTATDLGFEDGTQYQDPNIICHRNGTNAALSATVTAGSDVDIQWTTWPDSHHGPVITYLASCNGDCSTVDKTTLEFFKIDEVGLIDDTVVPGTWGTDQLIAAGNRWTVTIPSSIASGNYVMRHELIALHSAGQQNGAQNYPQCLNLEVTSSGSDVPAGTAGEELYTNTDPGILINIYTTLTEYIIPGPALYSG